MRIRARAIERRGELLRAIPPASNQHDDAERARGAVPLAEVKQPAKRASPAISVAPPCASPAFRKHIPKMRFRISPAFPDAAGGRSDPPRRRAEMTGVVKDGPIES
jgi:hypothetical protein